jgi:hypothetical protein
MKALGEQPLWRDVKALRVALGLPFRLTRKVDNITNPPTDAELDTAFGAPATLGEGFVGIVDDADAGTKVYLCTVSKAAWWYIELKEAV